MQQLFIGIGASDLTPYKIGSKSQQAYLLIDKAFSDGGMIEFELKDTYNDVGLRSLIQGVAKDRGVTASVRKIIRHKRYTLEVKSGTFRRDATIKIHLTGKEVEAFEKMGGKDWFKGLLSAAV